MRYTLKVPASKATNNFYKKTVARDAILRLIANLGAARLTDVARVYRPMDDFWHAEVAERTMHYLGYAYQHSAHAEAQVKDQAIAQRIDVTATLACLKHSNESRVPLTPTEAKKVIRSATPRSLLGAEATTWVDLETGFRSSKFRSPLKPILEAHWLRARSLAVDRADSSAVTQAKRGLDALLEQKLITVQRGALSQRIYSLTKGGRNMLGRGYENIEARSSTQSDHKTLATGYLLYALSDAPLGWRDGWSEGSMAASSAFPGVLGQVIKLRNRLMYEGTLGLNRSEFSVHPADGVVLQKLNEQSNKEDWAIELIEAERGRKQNSSFLRGLYPLQRVGNPDAIIQLSVNLPAGGLLVRNLRVSKITYVMSSDEFISPLLRACYQFVSGLCPDKSGVWRKAQTIKFEGTWDGNGDELQSKWEQLLSHIAVAICALSVVRRNFLGVPEVRLLRDFAEERGLLPHRKMLE